jgi:hypothetical protein
MSDILAIMDEKPFIDTGKACVKCVEERTVDMHRCKVKAYQEILPQKLTISINQDELRLLELLLLAS